MAPAPDGRLLRLVDPALVGVAPNGESFGRWLNGEGAPYPQITRTPNGSNAGLTEEVQLEVDPGFVLPAEIPVFLRVRVDRVQP